MSPMVVLSRLDTNRWRITPLYASVPNQNQTNPRLEGIRYPGQMIVTTNRQYPALLGMQHDSHELVTHSCSHSCSDTVPHRTIRSLTSRDTIQTSTEDCTTRYRNFLETRCLLDTVKIWSCFMFGLLPRRKFHRLLRPRVPHDHVRLTWICVSTLEQLIPVNQS
jgi:hypothetical protein